MAQQGWPEAVHLGKQRARVLSPPQLAAGDDDRVVPVTEGTTGSETGAMIQLFPMAGRIECISVLLFKMCISSYFFDCLSLTHPKSNVTLLEQDCTMPSILH